MHKDTIVIREIEVEDNPKIAKAIRSVLVEMGAPKVGTAYEDRSLDAMKETYTDLKKAYFVLAQGNEILGGAGIAQLENYNGNVCELQKMYFLPEARGKGLGAEMMKTCLNFAKQVGFDHCYLETLPYMKDAQKLYEKVGFKSLSEPLGDTGHYSCTVWMLKDL
ncbi:putative acetyltransferase [Winogradskyella epiphytica]|uniref:Putative acetyltransferase n=1 Tax=Winogradskyella epiphytica TaxID=262005 RepID=A0A2V4WWT5_9FLAO|nr:GNAT family N-acetyltransferase [Winogradskyella epiphytica]PYE81452.1 putative acetyltransferase [Winogradskyella epiphytica]GGW65030.1 N-acetyltransferase [Winogradskyella epiphytica]